LGGKKKRRGKKLTCSLRGEHNGDSDERKERYLWSLKKGQKKKTAIQKRVELWGKKIPLIQVPLKDCSSISPWGDLTPKGGMVTRKGEKYSLPRFEEGKKGAFLSTRKKGPLVRDFSERGGGVKRGPPQSGNFAF